MLVEVHCKLHVYRVYDCVRPKLWWQRGGRGEREGEGEGEREREREREKPQYRSTSTPFSNWSGLSVYTHVYCGF